MGAHEKSSVPPTKASCDDFLAFSETNDLHYLDTRGASYTWTSTRKGRHHTELRLERVICNKQWILSWDSSVCSTLALVKYDHHPLLFEAYKGDNFLLLLSNSRVLG